MISRGRFLFFIGVLTAALTSLAGCSGNQKASNDPILNQIALGYGYRQWQSVRYLRFDLVVRVDGKEAARFKHLWDRSTGRYRYEADSATFAKIPFFNELSGKWEPIGLRLPKGRLVGVVNRNTGNGAVYIDHQLQDSILIPRILERIDNDTFLLLMPLELGQAIPQGEAQRTPMRDGRAVMSIRLAFPQGAGITPYDRWMMIFEPKNQRILRTKVQPQRTNQVIAANWRGHTTINGITFSLERILKDKTITFESLTMPQTLADQIFVDPISAMP